MSPALYATFEPINAPTILIPEIAFAPLIKGVWSVAGTLVISSNPKKIDSTNKVKLPINNSGVTLSPLLV